MRRKERVFSPSCFILFAVVLFHHVQSFQSWYKQCRSAERRRHGLFQVEGDCHDRVQNQVVGDHPWYSHPKIERDRSHVQNRYNSMSDILVNLYQEGENPKRSCNDSAISSIDTSKFVIISSNGMWYRKSCASPSTASALYLTAGQLNRVIKGLKVMDSATFDKDSLERKGEPLVAWVGKYESEDYWVVSIDGVEFKDAIGTTALKEQIERVSRKSESVLDCKPLREFGDSLQERHDAAILATANGLVEFHRSHGFCSRCGGPTKATKAGASRTCTNECCRKSVYPRIDSAAIMLVTSPCENYALLGRKRSWPPGRYSTLAGFCEVGETLEECCQRETFEESGVTIDPRSVKFAASQPWPFPRSLMVGFRAKAMASSAALPNIVVDTNEMEDIRWFAKDFVKERVKLDGSTALTHVPSDDESKFHVPGKASLARHLITKWVNEEGKDETAKI